MYLLQDNIINDLIFSYVHFYFHLFRVGFYNYSTYPLYFNYFNKHMHIMMLCYSLCELPYFIYLFLYSSIFFIIYLYCKYVFIFYFFYNLFFSVLLNIFTFKVLNIFTNFFEYLNNNYYYPCCEYLLDISDFDYMKILLDICD